MAVSLLCLVVWECYQLCGVQTERVPRPTMTPEAQRILDIMGLSFSMSNELWIRVVRFWKDFLRYHQQEPAAMVLGLAQDSVSQTALSNNVAVLDAGYLAYPCSVI